jgi:hypothetical protein
VLDTMEVWPAKSKCFPTDCCVAGPPPKVSSLRSSASSSSWSPRPSYVSSKSMLCWG